MIEQLRIQGIGVIADAQVDLGPGLTVITGETGAGKTMILSGIELLRGARAESGQLRESGEQAEVDAVGAVTGPIDILSLLKDADTPAALLSSICGGATDLSKASKGWEDASDYLWDTAELDVLDLCEDLDWRQAASKLRVLGDDRGGASLAADPRRSCARATWRRSQMPPHQDSSVPTNWTICMSWSRRPRFCGHIWEATDRSLVASAV